MSETTEDLILLYTSSTCPHSFMVEKFMQTHQITTEIRNISLDLAWREEVMALNNGFASVPTLIFPDGTKMTEPSLSALRHKLGIEDMGLLGRIRQFLGSKTEE